MSGDLLAVVWLDKRIHFLPSVHKPVASQVNRRAGAGHQEEVRCPKLPHKS